MPSICYPSLSQYSIANTSSKNGYSGREADRGGAAVLDPAGDQVCSAVDEAESFKS
ncbi:Mre11_DNA_bind domain-containing protein [Psidium guajava]|nr:Mre11_DNA_bind domain-containing protein [Psidium guajava]